MVGSAITIAKDRWYAWQMIPGYVGKRCIPYFSPILVIDVALRKSGKGILQLDFWSIGYAQGIQDFRMDLQVLHRAESYLVARLMYGEKDSSDRCAIVSEIEFGWIEQFCPWIRQQRPPSSVGQNIRNDVQRYLDAAFRT